MKQILPAVFCLTLLFTSCAKQIDDEPKQSDSARAADSLLQLRLSTITKERLTGTWVRPIATQPGDEGYHLYADGKLKFINMYSFIGDSWELRSDTLMLYAHTERYPTPVPMIFRIASLSDSTLELVPENAAPNYTEKYRRKNFTLPERFSKTFRREFQGKILPNQSVRHILDVPTIFDGSILIESENTHISFTISKDGNVLTDIPVTTFKGSFPPGKYTLEMQYIQPKKKKAEPAQYTIIVAEAEIEK